MSFCREKRRWLLPGSWKALRLSRSGPIASLEGTGRKEIRGMRPARHSIRTWLFFSVAVLAAGTTAVVRAQDGGVERTVVALAATASSSAWIVAVNDSG